ncbi:MAG: endopeptidase La, partial [Bacteroidetes bacterium]
TIHPALRDRMEIIEINGYSLEEKLEIAKRHLLPKARKDHGLKGTNLHISPKALRQVIENYTRESGVRALAQQISRICRGAAKEIVLNENPSVRVSERNLHDFLGVKRFENEQYQKFEVPGVAIGLAWTQVGGEILFIESTLTPGTGKLSMTGQLGDVMRESGTLAYTYLRSNCDKFGIPYDVFRHWDAHLHIPAGAIPKDGPSAGVTMLTSLASLYSQRIVRPSLAMTGEITLRGKVLPVGGIKEKVLAAVRAGIKTLILCEENQKDVSEIKEAYIQGLDIRYVSRMEEVLHLALEPQPGPKAIDLLPKKSTEEEGTTPISQLEKIKRIVGHA